MATHSSVLAWRIPGAGKSGGLPSMRSHRVGHDWSDLAAAQRPDWWTQDITTGWHGWRSLVGCSPWDREESDTTELIHFHFSLSCIGEGNCNALQCSCLENFRDGGAWWAAVYEVAQSRTWLKRLSSSSGIIERNFQRVEWLQSFIHNKRLRNNFSYFSLVAAVLALNISKVIK